MSTMSGHHSVRMSGVRLQQFHKPCRMRRIMTLEPLDAVQSEQHIGRAFRLELGVTSVTQSMQPCVIHKRRHDPIPTLGHVLVMKEIHCSVLTVGTGQSCLEMCLKVSDEILESRKVLKETAPIVWRRRVSVKDKTGLVDI